jgi:alkylated DNA repair protein (DNA oxidative demethylase)
MTALTTPISATTGLRLVPGFFDRRQQRELVGVLREVVRRAPLFTPIMPGTGRPFSVRMTNCGPLGWVSDQHGYRYQSTHPLTGESWPPIPEMLAYAWAELADYPAPPQACLVNYYGPAARMGMHQDRDEEDLAAPVLSISLGATCRFRIGGTVRSASSRSFLLASGDALVLGGTSRLAFHGVDRIVAGTSTLLPDGGRINLTLRRVTSPKTGRRKETIRSDLNLRGTGS